MLEVRTFSEFVKFEILNYKWSTNQWKIILNTFINVNNIETTKDFSVKISIEGLRLKISSLFKEVFDINSNISKQYLVFKTKPFIDEEIIIKDDDRSQIRAYLAGLFLAKGSINNPEASNYRLEIGAKSIPDAINIADALSFFDIKSNQMQKKNWHYIFVTNPNQISDFIKLVHSLEAFSIFENKKIERDFIAASKKLSSLEKVNIIKTRNASAKQIELIKELKDTQIYKNLKQEIKDFFELRIKYSDYTFEDLKNIYNKIYQKNYSKSTINHWLRILKK